MVKISYIKIQDDFPNPIWRSDTEGKCDFFNRAWLKFTGRTMHRRRVTDGPKGSIRMILMTAALRFMTKKETFAAT